MLCVILILSEFLRPILWPNLENGPYTLEKNVYFVVVVG